MLVVVVMLSTIAGIALPRIDFVAMRLDGNVRTMRGTFQQAWRLAIQKQHDVLVSVDSAGRRMRILEDVNNNGVADPAERLTSRPLQDGVAFMVPPTGMYGPVASCVAGGGVRLVNTMPTVTFHRNGAASGDVQLYIGAMSHGQPGYRAVSILQATGRADWYRFVNGSWKSGGM